MEQDRPRSLRSEYVANAIYFLLFFVISLLLVKVITPYGLSTSPDSLAYLDMSASLQAGAGVVIPDRAIESYGQGNYVPVAIWPPLYPAFLAAVVPVTPDVQNVAYVSSFLLACTMAFIFLLLRRVVVGKIAFLLCMLYCATVPVLLDYSFVWSETLFLPLYCAALWAIVKYLEQDAAGTPARGWYLILLGLLIGAMFYTRYSGVSVSLLLICVFLASRYKRADLPYFFASGLIFSVPMLYLMYVNYELVGSVTGGDRPTSEFGISENLEQVRSSLAIVFPTDAGVWLICIALAGLLAFLLGRNMNQGQQVQSLRVDSGKTVLQVSLFLAVFYLIAIVIMRSVKFFDEIGIRLISPAFPPFWVFLCAAAFLPMRLAAARFVSALLAFALILALCFQGWVFYQHIRSSVTASESPVYPYRTDEVHQNFTIHKYMGELPRLIAEKFPDLPLMASQRTLRLEFVTGVSAVSLPNDFDVDFISRLANLAQPAGLFFMTRAEYDRFAGLSSQIDIPFVVYPTKEGVLVILNP